jgi:RNA polymerase sigma-70 factor (ECF subfamily)
VSSLHYNEKDLLLKVADGDENAFAIIFQNWLPFLSSHIFRITESKELTEEIVQDVFLKIWLTREALIEIDNFKAYLVVVSRNYALNSLRKISRERKKYKKWEQETHFSLSEDTESNNSDIQSLIDIAISNLPERQRQVYMLHRFEQMKYHEIAQSLSIGKETVKTHMKLAVGSISAFIRSKMVIFMLFF